MGLRYNKRTKGKDSWFNVSKSGITRTVKLTKNLTLNLGNKGTRTTVNLGNGFKYVASKKHASTRKRKVVDKDVNYDVENPAAYIFVLIVSLIVLLLSIIFDW